MELHSLQRPRGQRKGRRVGRGGKRGKTSGRGGKGQTARAGNKPRPEWRDTVKKLPKRRGFGKNRSRTAVPRTPFAPINLGTLAQHFKDGDTVSPAVLVSKGLVRRVSGKLPPVKILGRRGKSGEAFKKKLSFKGVAISGSARSAIEETGSAVNNS